VLVAGRLSCDPSKELLSESVTDSDDDATPCNSGKDDLYEAKRFRDTGSDTDL